MKKYVELLLISLLMTPASCSFPPPQSPPLKIVIYATWPTSAVIFIAQEHGLFAKYGVPITFVPTADYLEAITFYKEGKADITFAALTDAIVLDAEWKSTRFIYAVDYSKNGDFIVGQPTLNNLSDLKGKKVSFEGFNSFSHLFVLKLLERVGLKEGDFQAANIENTSVLDALETGKIDAGHVYGIAIPTALAKGYKILGKAGDVPYLITDGFVADADILKTRRQDVQGVVNVLAEAIDWLKQYPEEGAKIIAKYTNIPQAELETTLKGIHIFTSQENKAAFKQKGALIETGQEIIEFFREKGTLLNLPNINKIIDGQFVNAIGDK
ncbi:MAG: ABC transporter substrate-binding protein [Thiotrichaceae bacterium]|nr:ABC transporter substrate-binding protein [Thiotrichaceae bacterium]